MSNHAVYFADFVFYMLSCLSKVAILASLYLLYKMYRGFQALQDTNNNISQRVATIESRVQGLNNTR